MDAKPAHQLVRIAHEHLFQVFLDVRKAYGSLERGTCLEILRGYWLGLNLACLLKSYRKRHRIVPQVSKCLWTALETRRGVTQGYPTSPMIFNIVVDAVVWVVLDVFCSP